jgi:MFS transporter, DHA1 family, quinolone resistance protein
MNTDYSGPSTSTAALKWLTCLMFFMFAMTSDAVGSIIPKVVAEFDLSLTAAGAFHYVPMLAIAVGALFLGFLADRIGRKRTILIGLALYGFGSLLFAFGNSIGLFITLLGVSGVGISVFKIGALALIGDISTGPRQHTASMNAVEGFFGIGSILGPLLVAVLISNGWSWTWLYVVAAGICGLLLLLAARVHYPEVRHGNAEPIDLRRTLRMMRHPYALGFSGLIALYVAVEVAIYVWMPTYLLQYSGDVSWLPTYALTIFFVLRVIGRFLGIWVLDRFHWASVLALFGVAIFLCFAASIGFGADVGAWLLPLSGLFMSMLYPTLNSKGISCYEKDQHGAVAGLILFFTAAAAALGPLAMASISDGFGNVRYGFILATLFAALLALGLIYNWWFDPAASKLRAMESMSGNTH